MGDFEGRVLHKMTGKQIYELQNECKHPTKKHVTYREGSFGPIEVLYCTKCGKELFESFGVGSME